MVLVSTSVERDMCHFDITKTEPTLSDDTHQPER